MKLSYVKTLLVLITLIALTFCLSFVIFRYKKNNITLNHNDYRNGDIIFRRGRSIESLGVCVASKTMDFSHVGLITKQGYKCNVFHIVPAKDNEKATVKMETLEQFLHPENTSKYAVFRTTYTSKQIEQAIAKSNDFYDTKCTFDNEYSLNTNKKLYCTELVAKSFAVIDSSWLKIQQTKINMGFFTKDVLLPTDILKAKILQPVDITY